MRVDQSRTHNRLNEITGLKNSVATRPDWAKPRYDASGNTTRIPGVDPTKPQRVQYDAWNRPVRVFGYGEGWQRQRTVAYQYDGRGWRTRTLDYGPVDEEHPDGFQNQTDHYYDEGWRRVEGKTYVPDEIGEEVESFVWDYAANGYPDALLCRMKGEVRVFPLQDAHFNTVAIKAAGTDPILERYSYSAFGVPTFLDGDFTLKGESSYDWWVLFSSYRYEPKTGVYYVRNRDYSPLLGRWLSRDPIGENGGINLYGFCNNTPINQVDRLGEKSGESKFEVTIKTFRFYSDVSIAFSAGNDAPKGKCPCKNPKLSQIYKNHDFNKIKSLFNPEEWKLDGGVFYAYQTTAYRQASMEDHPGAYFPLPIPIGDESIHVINPLNLIHGISSGI